VNDFREKTPGGVRVFYSSSIGRAHVKIHNVLIIKEIWLYSHFSSQRECHDTLQTADRLLYLPFVRNRKSLSIDAFEKNKHFEKHKLSGLSLMAGPIGSSAGTEYAY